MSEILTGALFVAALVLGAGGFFCLACYFLLWLIEEVLP